MVSRYRQLDLQRVQRQIDLIKVKEIKNQIKMHQTAISNLKRELVDIGASMGAGSKGNRNMNLYLTKQHSMKGGIFE